MVNISYLESAPDVLKSTEVKILTQIKKYVKIDYTGHSKDVSQKFTYR